jgi:hypothetical protein
MVVRGHYISGLNVADVTLGGVVECTWLWGALYFGLECSRCNPRGSGGVHMVVRGQYTLGLNVADATLGGVAGCTWLCAGELFISLEHSRCNCGGVVEQGHVGVEQAVRLARLEEEVQIAEWGLVEGGHDIDLADTRVRICAPSIFIRLLRLSSNR